MPADQSSFFHFTQSVNSFEDRFKAGWRYFRYKVIRELNDSERSITLNHLQPGTSYYLHVNANSEHSQHSTDDIIFNTLPMGNKLRYIGKVLKKVQNLRGRK